MVAGAGLDGDVYALDLLRLLLHPDPVMRISADEALRHPYFTSARSLPPGLHNEPSGASGASAAVNVPPSKRAAQREADEEGATEMDMVVGSAPSDLERIPGSPGSIDFVARRSMSSHRNSVDCAGPSRQEAVSGTHQPPKNHQTFTISI